ncbi:SCO1/SenC family protein [Enhygromyxa salina]|uniref:SCO1/SenC family protein n=1 Tax=Enhygromyxa salina TaxID=215803 RepID=A0A0C2CZE8_9BACT|nr:SCO family protein [Enhygromyxa salina]KIG15025.1 SCO1/SenC family protein [Enhygromyxa salina]
MTPRSTASKLFDVIVTSLGLLVAGLLVLGTAQARPGRDGPRLGDARAGKNLSPEANEIAVDEMLGGRLDMDLAFVDHNGKSVKLGDYFDGERPVLLTLNYFRCPTLCSLQLNGLTRTLNQFDWQPGDEYRIVTVSIDPREGPELAASKRASHLEELGVQDLDWSFLTGDAAQIRMLAAQLGIGYAYDAEQDQYAHPAVLMFASPEGKVARYLYGLEYQPSDVKFALIEASEGRVGSPVDKLILSCFHYDASLGEYGPFAMGIMRLGGAFMVLIVGIPLVFVWRRERRRRIHPLGGNPSELEATA